MKTLPLLGRDSGSQAILARLAKRPQDGFDCFQRLSFAIDHFGKAAAGLTVQIDFRLAKVGNGGTADFFHRV